jgi:hypothetical protein
MTATQSSIPAVPDRAADVPPPLAPEDGMRAAGIGVRPIPRAKVSTPMALRRQVARRAGPMLFPGLAKQWRALAAWKPDELRRLHGDVEVTAMIGLPSGGVLLPQDQQTYEQTMSLALFVDAMLAATASSPCYLAYKRAGDLFDPADYDFDALLGTGKSGTDTRVWIGSTGTRSMLHSDLKDNLFCQIWGEKTITLLPWRDSKAAYPFTDNLVNSQIDLARPDLGKFPRMGEATFYNATVGPGDVLYIPRGCWHDIRSCTASVSVNHWFGKSKSGGEYLRLLGALGPRHWRDTARDFMVHGLLKRREESRFFFSPPSTGKRLYDAVRWGGFSRENDPSDSEQS